jgi:GDP-mannose transporter
VYYNNLLSVPAIALLSLFSGDPWRLAGARQVGDPRFQAVAVAGGLLGFGVSFASIWCMSRTSATIYSLTGSMNKARRVCCAVCAVL